MAVDLILILIGLFGLYLGAEWLVRGASSLALRLGIPPIIIGLTVVAFGTSSPEMVVSIQAALGGSADVALGNVVGSNIGNIGLILGLVCLFQPLSVRTQIMRFDGPVMIWTTVLMIFLLLDRLISRMEGLLLVTLLIVYVLFSIRESKKEDATELPEELKDVLETPKRILWMDILFAVGGIGCMVVGGKFLVDGAVNIARTFEISEAVIGLTLVAIGTSLPELATSLVAAFRKKADIAIGNVVGSNIFNVLSVLGFSSMVKPIASAGITGNDLAMMMFFSVAPLPLMWRTRSLNRMHGAFLLVCYFFYLSMLI